MLPFPPISTPHSPDMTELDLRGKNLTDAELETRLETELQRLGPDTRVEVLYLFGNRLTFVPNLTRHMTHFTGLKILDLCFNQISVVSVDRIPPTVTHLSLDNNRLTDIDLFPLTRLTDLNLWGNPTLTRLTGLPESLTDLYIDRGVRVLGEKCFSSEKTYQTLKKRLNTKSLVQPPAEIFNRGLQAVREYFKKHRQQNRSGADEKKKSEINNGNTSEQRNIDVQDSLTKGVQELSLPDGATGGTSIFQGYQDETPLDGPWDGKTVEIRGFTDQIEEYMLQLIFEDRDLSGGGPVDPDSIEVDYAEHIAHLAFKDAEDACEVLKRSTVEFEGHTLIASKPHAVKKIKPRVLVVSEFDPSSSTKRLELFFKNNSQSGGGPIKSLQMNKTNTKLAIEFKEQNYIESVMSQERSQGLQFGGRKLKVQHCKAEELEKILNQEETVSDQPRQQSSHTDQVSSPDDSQLPKSRPSDETSVKNVVKPKRMAFEDIFHKESALGLDMLDIHDLKINRNDRIGAGNYGAVYKTSFHGTQVAVKEILIPKRKGKHNNPSVIVSEIEVSAAIRHPSVVQFMGYAINSEQNTHVLLLVYELINGHNLDQIIYSDELVELHCFDLTKRFNVLLQVSQGLAYLHSRHPKIIHGDIKPANIMVSRHGQAKICDLGLSKMKKYSTQTLTSTLGAPKGTPIYMAPEMLLSQNTSSIETDVYSFGATMYEVLFGSPMWDIEDEESDLDEISLLKQKIQTEKIPKKLLQPNAHTARKLINTCVQFEPALQASTKLIIEELNKLCHAT